MAENIGLDVYHGVISAPTLQRALSPSVLEEFPSLVTMQVLPRVTDSSPAKRLMCQLLSSIRTTGTFRLGITHFKLIRERSSVGLMS